MKTVIEMAREAGFETASEWEKHPNGFVRVVSRFAELVTEQANARANTSWALMCKKMVEAEREACAKLVEGYDDHTWGMLHDAIRARSNT